MDNNMFSGLHSKLHFENFFKDLQKFETIYNIDEKNRRYISTPFSIMEYLGMPVSQRPKPKNDEVTNYIKSLPPEKSFFEFCKYALDFFSNAVPNYYETLLERNRQKIQPLTEDEIKYAIKPHLQELWNLLITQEILKEDFLLKLLKSLWWDYVTDWVNKMPNKIYKNNISENTSDMLNEGMKLIYEDSINLLRLVKNFHSLVDLKKVESLNDLQKDIIEDRRNSLLKSQAFKPATEDLVDSDIIQYSVTGFKDYYANIFPVISFTTDSATVTENRVRLLKDIIGVYYNKTIKDSDRKLIENFNQGKIICLSKFSKDTTFECLEILDIETINESWLISSH